MKRVVIVHATKMVSDVCLLPTQLNLKFPNVHNTATEIVLGLGVRYLVLRFFVHRIVEPIQKRISISHQAIYGLIHFLANPSDLAVKFSLSDMAFSDRV